MLESLRAVIRSAVAVGLLIIIAFCALAQAKEQAESVPYRAALLMEAETGQVLFDEDIHSPYPPASMVKMMTALVVLDMVKKGALSFDDVVVTSAHASRMGGSQVYLKQGEKFTLREMLEALMIHSANDAAVALAEHAAGTTEEFVGMMNAKARELGLRETVYHSVHGLPPAAGQDDDLMSAYDLGLLARVMLKYPEVSEWGATKSKPFRGGSFTLYNPNRLLGKFPGLDGIKTGYHRRAGFCVTASAERKQLRLITVVMGSSRREDCFANAARLLRRGFNTYIMYTPVRKGEVLSSPLLVRDGVRRQVDAVAMADLKALVKRGEEGRIKLVIEAPPGGVQAPVRAGAAVASASLVRDGEKLAEVPVAPFTDVAQASVFLRLLRMLDATAN